MFDYIKALLNSNSNDKSLNDESLIFYLMNDPGTPNLWKYVPVPTMMSPSYKVKGYDGGGYDLNTREGRAAQVFVVITETLKWVQHHAPRQLPNWATGLPLIVDPEAGQDLNAYYHRKGMKFFYSGTVYTAESSDVVAHELGHAIFDSYRPKSWNLAALEIWSFHEAFADITGVITALQNEEVINSLLKTKYLSRDNFVSRIGEEIGKAIYNFKKGEDGRKSTHLRNASIVRKYVNPSTLPKRGRHNTLSAESHSFGRIMLSAFYQIFYNMYEHNVLRGLDQDHALVVARNLLSKYLLKAIAVVPLKTNFYESFAQAMMWSADNKSYHNIMLKIFRQWNIVNRPNDIKVLNHEIDKIEVIKLSEEIEMSILDYNPLYEVEVEIPADDRENSIADAKRCLDLLHQTNSVGDDESTPFEIQNNKLIRTYID